MQTYRVTQLIKNYQVFHVEAHHWKEAKQRVDDKLIDPHHTDVSDEVEVVFVDSLDGRTTYYEEGMADEEEE